MVEGPPTGMTPDLQPIETRGSFEVMDRTVMHDRFGMQLIGDTVKRPDGSMGQQYWVNFPQESVLVFPLDQDKNIYLAEEFTYAANERKLEAAGGSINPGEDAEAAARREVYEELGVEVDELKKIGTFESITSRVSNKAHAYLARVAGVSEAHPETGEDIKLSVMTFNTALELVRRGVINTAVIAAAIWAINDILEHEDLPSN